MTYYICKKYEYLINQEWNQMQHLEYMHDIQMLLELYSSKVGENINLLVDPSQLKNST